MNLIHIQDQLKGLPTQAIMAYANGQNPEVPPYVALAELNRRKQMQSGAGAMQGGQQPTVKDQIEQSTGLMGLQNAQQQQSMQQMARAPQQGPVPQSAPQGPVQGAPQEGFAGGGAVAFNGEEQSYVDPNDMYIDSPSSEGGGSDIPMGATEREAYFKKKAEEEAAKARLEKMRANAAQLTRRPGGISRETAESGLPHLMDEYYRPRSSGSTPTMRAPAAPAAPQAPAVANQPAAMPPAAPAPASKPAMPAPQQVQKPQPGIVGALPAAAPENQEEAKELTKYNLETLRAKPDLKANMATAAGAMPRDPLEAEVEANLRADRKAQLARREAPKNWYENEGLMATLRGFAQSDPRRPWGAAGAASADFNEKQAALRAKEDAMFREGLAGLSKSAQERVKAQFDYAVKQGENDAVAKRDAAGNIERLLANKETNATSRANTAANIVSHEKISANTNATQMAIAKAQIEAAAARAKSPEERAFVIDQKIQATIQADPEYKKAAELSSMPGKIGDTARATMQRIKQETWQRLAPGEVPPELKSGIATTAPAGATSGWGQARVIK